MATDGQPVVLTQGQPVVLGQPAVLKQGQIFKRSTELHGQIFKRSREVWNERWAVLTAQELTIHENEGAKVKHTLRTARATVDFAKHQKEGFTALAIKEFRLDGIEVELATDRNDATAWLRALKQAGAQSTDGIDAALLPAIEVDRENARDAGLCLSCVASLYNAIFFSDGVKRVRDAGRCLDGVALVAIGASLLSVHSNGEELLVFAALVFMLAAVIEGLTCLKGDGERDSWKNVKACCGDFYFALLAWCAAGLVSFAKRHAVATAFVAHTLAAIVEAALIYCVIHKVAKRGPGDAYAVLV